MGTEVTVDADSGDVTVTPPAAVVVEVNTGGVVVVEVQVAGPQGIRGKSAYQVAVDGGFVGNEAAWLASLEGSDGNDGASAYEIAVANGFVGTEAEWLESLQGESPAIGGSTTQVQFNDAGQLAGDPTFVFDKDTDTLSVPRVNTDSLHHVLVVGGDQSHEFASDAYGALVSATTTYGDGSSYSEYVHIVHDSVLVANLSFDDLGNATYGTSIEIRDGSVRFSETLLDGKRTVHLRALDAASLDSGETVFVEVQAKSGTLATLDDITSADFATTAQGVLADSAVQPEDLATVATSGAYADLTGKPALFSGAYADLTGKPPFGTATLAFGADPGAEYASVAVTGQAGIASNSAISAWFQADTTGSNTANTHEAAAAFVRLVATDIVPGTGFTIKAFSLIGKFSGDLKVRWTWK